jgi:diguanylate cyclase (GGDEF)-like protein
MRIETQPSESTTARSTEADAEIRARIDALNERAYKERGADLQGALALAEEALDAARSAGYRAGEGYALWARGTCRSQLFELDAAFVDLESSLAIFDELRDSRGRARALQRIGILHCRRGDNPAALACLTSALELHRAVGNRLMEAETLNSLGNVHHELGAYAQALEAYNASLAIFQQSGNRIGLAEALNNLGNIHGELKEYVEAEEYHGRSLTLAKEAGNRRTEAISSGNLGLTYYERGEHARALELFTASLSLAREVGDRACEAGILANMGNVHRALGDLGRGFEHYHASLEVSRLHGIRFYEAQARLLLGEAFAEQGQVNEALDHLSAALRMHVEIGAREQEFSVHAALSAAHEAAGNVAAALKHYKEFHRVREEVWSTESDRRIQSILVQAEVERTRREAEILREKNEELDRLSREDSLTGLSNRRHVDERLALEWERARRFGRDLSVVLADLDHFKSINDRFSHAAGDEVLRAVGRILRESTRQLDVVGRWGGEEFVLVLVETPPEKAALFCEKLRAAVEAFDWPAIHPGLSVTISMGVAGNVGVDSPESLLAAADARLYQAKREGRNRVQS